MPEDSSTASSRRLAVDLSRIREAHGVSLQALHDETKIPLGLIEAFEHSALLDHPQFNKVYLRSFVRTYAQVVEIDPDVALRALEDALEGRYDGSLAVTYLGEAPPAAAPPAPASPRGEQRQEAAPLPPATRPGTPSAGEETRTPAVRETETPVESTYISTTTETAVGRETDWTVQSPPAGVARDRSAAERRPVRRSGPPSWIWLVVLGVVVAGLAAWFLLVDRPEEAAVATPGTPAQTASRPDTAASGFTGAGIALPELGDTLEVFVVADEGRLDPIRVTVDEDLRRPYWIEQGDSMRFGPTERIVVEELLDRVRITVEGVPYPTGRRDAQNRIVITRDSLRDYFATLSEEQRSALAAGAADTTAGP